MPPDCCTELLRAYGTRKLVKLRDQSVGVWTLQGCGYPDAPQWAHSWKALRVACPRCGSVAHGSGVDPQSVVDRRGCCISTDHQPEVSSYLEQVQESHALVPSSREQVMLVAEGFVFSCVVPSADYAPGIAIIMTTGTEAFGDFAVVVEAVGAPRTVGENMEVPIIPILVMNEPTANVAAKILQKAPWGQIPRPTPQWQAIKQGARACRQVSVALASVHAQ